MTVYFRHPNVNPNAPHRPDHRSEHSSDHRLDHRLDHRPGTGRPLRQHKAGVYRTGGKIIFDWLLVLASLPVVLPLVAILAVLVALDGAAPFYRQRRVGRGGKIFHLLKIRTMVPNAEGILQDYLAQNPEARREWDRNQKLRNDPRITRLGCFLRKSSIDELPQLWNVLRGNMSLIGPRPMMLDQRARYPGTAYYHLRPGITGLWQVSDRNQSSFAERAEFDTEYYHTLSLKTDWSIFWRTISVVLRGTGY